MAFWLMALIWLRELPQKLRLSANLSANFWFVRRLHC